MTEMIKSMDYVTVTSRKLVKGSGLKVGQKALVIGTRVLPFKKSDPYLSRTYAYIILVDDDGTHHMPNQGVEDDNGERTYLVDPRSLTKLDKEEAEKLAEAFKNEASD